MLSFLKRYFISGQEHQSPLEKTKLLEILEQNGGEIHVREKEYFDEEFHEAVRAALKVNIINLTSDENYPGFIRIALREKEID